MINYILILIISAIRPFFGPATCRYYFTCTPFAIDMLKKKPFYKAIPVILKRILLCNPFTR